MERFRKPFDLVTHGDEMASYPENTLAGGRRGGMTDSGFSAALRGDAARYVAGGRERVILPAAANAVAGRDRLLRRIGVEVHRQQRPSEKSALLANVHNAEFE